MTDPNNVPSNDISKIMFYLNCVCHCIDYNNDDIQRYTNYSNWSALSKEETQFLFFLSLNLSPDLFIGKVFFPTDQLNRDIKETFYEIGQVRQQFTVVPSVVIEGRTCEIHRILSFNQIWLEEYYLHPMNRLVQRRSH